MLARRFLFLAGILALSLTLLGAQPMRPLPGLAQPYEASTPEAKVDPARLQAISALAAGVYPSRATWTAIAATLEARATHEFGP